MSQLPEETVIMPEGNVSPAEPVILENSPFRLAFVLGPVHGLLAFALDASWKLRAAPGAPGVALMATIRTNRPGIGSPCDNGDPERTWMVPGPHPVQ